MGYPRKSLICLDDTPYYHVVARCVRRAWLWGYDTYAGKDYSHRKAWILHRLRMLGSIFSIDLCAYAVMSNHYHLVLRVDRERMDRWSRTEVVARWGRIFSVPPLIRRWQEGDISKTERALAEHLIERWRRRLGDISWYMRCLNEYLARRANAEDECTGRFWEGRFKSQALLDELGLLTAMAYVDLNPVRAGIAATPEESEFTSIYARVKKIRSGISARVRQQAGSEATRLRYPALLGFNNDRESGSDRIPMRSLDYFRLLQWSSRQRRQRKSASIGKDLPAILVELKIDPSVWLQTIQQPGALLGRAIGNWKKLRTHAERLGQTWIAGMGLAQRLLS
jgi:REP element-mobilizing transposase RayT